jgi:diacylglycerol O-acyltransferase / wax synthase
VRHAQDRCPFLATVGALVNHLTGLDASFLYAETSTSHMHLLAVAVLDIDRHGAPLTYDAVRARLAERLPVLPALRRRLVSAPLGLDHPLWIEDPRFELADHIRRVAVSPPGGTADLARVVADHASRPLDRNRPLWDVCLVEGLEHGQVALVFKLHHAIADGISALTMLAGFFDTDVQPARATTSDDEWVPEAEPRTLDLLVSIVSRLPDRIVLAVRALIRAGVSAARVAALVRTPGLEGTMPFTAPRTRFNGAITGRRSVTFAAVDMSAVRQVKDQAGVTVNDVVVGVVAGALRRYLSARGELPTRALVAVVPASTAGNGEGRSVGANALSALFTRLSTHIRDPLERIRATVSADQDAKRFHAAIGDTLLAACADLAAPALLSWGARMYSHLRIADHQPPIHTLIVSSVAGPGSPLYFAGARLRTVFALGPIYDGAALNVTVVSYAGSLSFGVLTCPDVVPDVEAIAAELPDALVELYTAVSRAGIT